PAGPTLWGCVLTGCSFGKRPRPGRGPALPLVVARLSLPRYAAVFDILRALNSFHACAASSTCKRRTASIGRADGSRPENASKLPATWHAGRQPGPERKPKRFWRLRAQPELPASVPPKWAGPLFRRFLAPFRPFALDHTRAVSRRSPASSPRRIAPGPS